MKILLIILFVSVIPFQADAQIRPKPKEKKTNLLIDDSILQKDTPQSEFEKLTRKIEKYITESSVGELTNFLGEQVLIKVPGIEEGIYSSGQAATILRNYFSINAPIKATLQGVNKSNSNPYISGKLYVQSKGVRESLQIYLSFSSQDSKFELTRINIY